VLIFFSNDRILLMEQDEDDVGDFYMMNEDEAADIG
jgi:hypothetical protein